MTGPGGEYPYGDDAGTRQDVQEAAAAARAEQHSAFDDHATGLPFVGGMYGLAETVGDLADRAGASAGSGYKFDAEQIAQKIRQFEDLRDKMRAKREELRDAAWNVAPPSGDRPAEAQARATKNSIAKAEEHNRSMQDYAQAYVDALRKANGTYVAREDDTSGAFEGTKVNDGAPSGTGTLFQ